MKTILNFIFYFVLIVQLGYSQTTTWNGSTWDNGVPDATKDAIFNGNFTVNSGNLVCKNIQINTGFSLVVAAGYAITCQENITIIAGASLLLDSDASSTPSGILLCKGICYGDVTLKRYYSGSKHHYLSVPVTGVPTSTFGALGAPSVYNFFNFSEPIDHTPDPTTMAELGDGWIRVGTAGFAHGNLEVGKGYVEYDLSNKTLTFSGAITNNPVSLPLSFTPNDGITYDGHCLVGNPYTAPLDWNSPTIVKTNIDNSIYFYDGTQYASWNGTFGTNFGTQYIPAMQGFFVHANGGSPVLTVSTKDLVTNTQNYWKSAQATNGFVRIKALNNVYADDAVVYFNPNGTAAFDATGNDADALKNFGGTSAVPNIYSVLSDNTTLVSINSLPLIDQVYSVNIGFKCDAGMFSFNLSENTFPAGAEIKLVDFVDGNTINFAQQKMYTFNHTGGQIDNRFRLTFRIIPTSNEKLLNSQTTISFAQQDNIAVFKSENFDFKNSTFECYDMLGKQLVYNMLNVNSNQLEVSLKAPTGIYIARFTNGDKVQKKRFYFK